MADLDHLHPVFRERVLTALDDYPSAYVLSGGRSNGRQSELSWCYQQKRATGRCPPACGGSCHPANAAGTSWHEYDETAPWPNVGSAHAQATRLPGGPWALAVDLAGDYAGIRRNAARYRLCFPIAGEGWHAQPAEITESARVVGAWERLPAPAPPPDPDPLRIGGRPVLLLDSGLVSVRIETFADKALDVAGVAVNDRAVLHQWEVHDGPNQRFFIDPCGTPDRPDLVRIIARHSGRVLDLAGPGPAGSTVWQYPWAGADNQKWRLEHIEDNRYVIVSAWKPAPDAPDLVLDIEGASTDNGARLQVWNRNGQPQQEFWIVT